MNNHINNVNYKKDKRDDFKSPKFLQKKRTINLLLPITKFETNHCSSASSQFYKFLIDTKFRLTNHNVAVISKIKNITVKSRVYQSLNFQFLYFYLRPKIHENLRRIKIATFITVSSKNRREFCQLLL